MQRLPFTTGDLQLRTVALYLVFFTVVWLVPSLAYRWLANELLPSFTITSSLRGKPEVRAKVAYYRQHHDEYDLIFVGDSRTYCALSPTDIDPLLGTHSINLSSMAHWFPTQYPSLEDVLPLVPKNTVVVWSIGHQNFHRVHAEVNNVYPIGLHNVLRYLRWGYPWASIRGNVIDGLPGLQLYSRRGELHDRVAGLLDRVLRRAPIEPAIADRPGDRHDAEGVSTPSGDGDIRHGTVPPDEVAGRMAELRADPDTMWVEPVYDGAFVTSLTVYQRGGNYVRVELDPEYFREVQRRLAAQQRPAAEDRFTPEPAFWNTFVGIVELFDRYGVRLVVNEFEEAPYQYQISHNAEIHRGFMREIHAFFEARGTPYVRVDFERLHDEDYFDYNHLNSKGIAVFSRMFADALRPHLSRD